MKKLQSLIYRPRYLRAIPSLVVLTTAMAWSVAPDTDVFDGAQKKATISLSHSTGTTAMALYDGPPGLPAALKRFDKS
jgi:hypothetical protein